MKILLPTDGSAAALQAVAHTVQLLQRGLQASVVLLNVQEPASLYELVVVHDAERIERMRRSAGAELLEPAEALLDAAGVDYESEVAGGDPHHTVVEAAELHGCAAIVLGARGQGALDGGAFDGPGELGSVAQAVLARSGVPVTIVRPPAAPDAA